MLWTVPSFVTAHTFYAPPEGPKKLLKDTAYYNKLDIFAQFITTRVKQKQSLECNYVNDVCSKCRLN